MSKRIMPFSYFGGKFQDLKWLLPLLPYTQHFVDVFGGSAVVLLNRKRSPIETYNDIDGSVVNFFRVLRDHSEELIRRIVLTPVSRQEFREAIQNRENPEVDPIERARLFYVVANQAIHALTQTDQQGNWGFSVTSSYGGVGTIGRRWLNAPPQLMRTAERLRGVQIENDRAVKVIERYDSPDTLFYCDPPYVLGARSYNGKKYRFEMSDDEHRELAEVLHSVEGKVAISGYDSDLYRELYKDWYVTKGRKTNINITHTEREELLWSNYRPTFSLI